MNVMSNVRVFVELFCDWNRVIDSSGKKTAIFLTILF